MTGGLKKMSDAQHVIEDDRQVTSPDRRSLLKKVAYTAPVIIALGVVTPVKIAHAQSPAGGIGGPPCGPGEQCY